MGAQKVFNAYRKERIKMGFCTSQWGKGSEYLVPPLGDDLKQKNSELSCDLIDLSRPIST